MTPATIIREAQAAGVKLTLSPTGTLKAAGDGAAVNRWLAVIREHKAEIIDALTTDRPPPARRPPTDSERAELLALVQAIYATDTDQDRHEAVQMALADPEGALMCYRAIAAERGLKIEQPQRQPHGN